MNVLYPRNEISEKVFMNKNEYYYNTEIKALRTKLKECGLSFVISKRIAHPHIRIVSSDGIDITTYDINLKFRNRADAAFYKMLISEL